MKSALTHFDNSGAAHMVDVTQKKSTARIAIAKSTLLMLPSTLKNVEDIKSKKGDVLGVARLAGIMAAKKTSELIPLCHPLPLTKISISFSIEKTPSRIELEAIVKTTGKTGVEMEALTAVTVSALTIYDMLKSVDKNMTITETCLIFKDGGKSGQYQHQEKFP